MKKLNLQKVSKKRFVKRGNISRDILVLDKIDLFVEPGDLFTIIGPSGSGKSTLLRLLNRLEDTSGGEIFLDGENIKKLDVIELRRKVGLVFQVPVMFDSDVEENIFYGLRLLGGDGKKGTAEKCLDLVGLGKGFLTRDSTRLSVGEKQRVSIARTLMVEPEVLLLDEPTSALDPTATLEIEKLILELNRKLNLTVLLVTHNILQARRVGHKSMVMVEGKKVEEGLIEDLFVSPKSELTKRFLEGNLKKESRDEF